MTTENPINKDTKITLTITPKEVTLPFHGDQKFTVEGVPEGVGVNWTCEGAGKGTMDQSGWYRAGVHVGDDVVMATTVVGVTQEGVGSASASALVHVTNPEGESR